MGRLLLPALVALLAGCGNPSLAIVQAQDSIATAVVGAQVAAAKAVTGPALELQDSAQAVVPEPLPAALPVDLGAQLIVRAEVTSAAAYTRRYSGVSCPGGSSGPTIGIGADLGQQTVTEIGRDWAGHPRVAELQTASAHVGDAECRHWRSQHPGIHVPFAMAEQVFAKATLPRYVTAAGRALHRGWKELPPHAQGANVSLGYNRGWSMSGDRNREKRSIRDDCVPNTDLPCNAQALRGMCHLWAGTPNGKGLCSRRNDEANLVELP
jgi:GH24 family phage-related lysozyme (muramidase)